MNDGTELQSLRHFMKLSYKQKGFELKTVATEVERSTIKVWPLNVPLL